MVVLENLQKENQDEHRSMAVCLCRWVRILRVLVGVLFFALIVGAVYITVKYS